MGITIISFPDALHKALRAIAGRKGMALDEYIISVLLIAAADEALKELSPVRIE